MTISLDKANQKLIGASVSTSVDDPQEKVGFNITFNSLPDGTQFTANTTLDAQAKKVKIVIENSGYKNSAGQ